FAGGVLQLIILRTIVGLGLGAELPVASTLVQEVSPRRIRGSITVWLEAFWALGRTAAALIGYFVVPLSDDGWRIAFGIGALPALYALVLRLHLPESVRFLLHKGEDEKAAQVVDELADGHVPLPAQDGHSAEATSLEKPTWGKLFSPSLRKRTVAIWTVWFMVNLGYYGSSIWIPSILHANGHDLVKSFGFTLIITLAQLPGYATSAYLIEHWGRRATLTTFLLGSSLGAVGFGMADSSTAIIATGCVLSFFNLGAWGALYAITPEIYPTFIRATGAGAATGFGRLASIAAPFLVTFLLGIGGVPGGNKGLLFPVLAGAFIVAAVATLALPERKGQSLS
ncbi:MAG: MFS transporter, partial [Ancrocorticia sp.]|uniref:MFS transporter n=1 Tax=Ancrocorticia sp. TaxID=2593684 RepID=UPI003F8E6CD9